MSYSNRRSRRKRIIKIVLEFIFVLSAISANALAANIGDLAWNQTNIAALRSVGKEDLAASLNERQPGVVTAAEIAGFGWADPAGDGQYRLVLALSGPCAHFLVIYARDDSGNVTAIQSIDGFANFENGIRDLNGDGKDELVVGKSLIEYSCIDVITWPAVYRFQNGKYVEASRDFPAFYDNEVLPRVGADVSKMRGLLAAGHTTPGAVAHPLMERDKILRVLGRDPTAGLRQAYQWMNTDDPHLLLDAAATLKDIGGHDKEANAAATSYRRALCERTPGMAMCKDTARR